ncbi:hypothetical protein [Sorangium sp. So ce362]|uniref:hypothetical protein n=1 Tax=Sorangium sp. So ce362 TaxID=3133303 RepID=UPI003F6419E7
MRDTRPYADDPETGYGIYVIADIEANLQSEATLRRVVVEQNRFLGVAFLGSDASNQCGCQGASFPCRTKSAGLTPPESLPPVL